MSRGLEPSMSRRDLCDTAKKGRVCIDDLCRGVGETLCGFDPDLYDEMLGEDYPPEEEREGAFDEHR